MTNATTIEWTDATWNPVVGCKAVSPGCAHCYAETMAKRLAAMAEAEIRAEKNPGRKRHYLNVVGDNGRWNGDVWLVPESTGDPFKWRKPRRVFVNSMSDLFHEGVPCDFVDTIFATMYECQHHTFQVLTKRPERAAEYLNCSEVLTRIAHKAWWALHGRDPEKAKFVSVEDIIADFITMWPIPNVWIGTSVEDQQRADERIPHLLSIPAAVRFLSCEPLLGPVVLDGGPKGPPTHLSVEIDHPEDKRIDWVICGGESGPGARPMHGDWVRSIHDQCQQAGVPFFFKQWGAWKDGSLVGKKAAGRMLDGREWSEFPER